MDPYERSYDGDLVRITVDTRPGFETENETNYSRVFHRTESLFNVVSDKTKPYINKKQSYSTLRSSAHSGTFRETRVFSNGVRTITTSGIVGSNPSFGPLGNATEAINNSIGKLSEYIRGGIDLSIDSFQWKMTKRLATDLLSARKWAERIVHALEQTHKYRVPIGLAPKGSRKRYRQDARRRDRKLRKENALPIETIAAQPLKKGGDAWLMWTYGLKPTLQTIHDIVTGEAERVGNSLSISGRGTNGERTKKANGSIKFREEDVSEIAYQKTTTLRTSSYRCLIGGTYEPGSTYVEGLSRLTSLNPASIAWELLPFSFVCDWFLDIGGYLRNMETALLSNMLGTFNGFITTTECHTSKEVVQWTGFYEPFDSTFSGSSTASTRLVHKNRGLLTTFPLPRPPQFKADLGSGRLLNAAALLTTLLKGKK